MSGTASEPGLSLPCSRFPVKRGAGAECCYLAIRSAQYCIFFITNEMQLSSFVRFIKADLSLRQATVETFFSVTVNFGIRESDKQL